MKRFVIEEELLKEILNYLANKPYAEVFNLITSLTKLPEFVESPEKKS